MIFVSKNEDGELAWHLIMVGRKTVTRRLKPVDVGKIVAVCPGRGKKAIVHIKILDCRPHKVWYRRTIENAPLGENQLRLQAEAEKEGFGSWMGLCDWLIGHGVDLFKTYRIEFKLIR